MKKDAEDYLAQAAYAMRVSEKKLNDNGEGIDTQDVELETERAMNEEEFGVPSETDEDEGTASGSSNLMKKATLLEETAKSQKTLRTYDRIFTTFKKFATELCPDFDPNVLNERLPKIIQAFLFQQCDFADQKGENDEVLGCLEKSVSNLIN
jgi:hypothetical protein